MTVYITSNHDSSMIQSQTETMPTDAELRMIDELTDTTVETDNVDEWIDSMMMGMIEDIQY